MRDLLQSWYSSILFYTKAIFASPHFFFLFESLVFGLLFIIITPPLQGPDEQAHFFQAYEVSEGKIVYNATDTYPKSLKETYKTIFYNDDIRFAGNNKYEIGRTKVAFHIPLNQGSREVSDGYMTGTAYPPVTYAGSAVLILLGRVFSFAPVLLIYLARVGSLAVWVLLIYLAIRMTPIGKWQFAVVSIIPMAVFQSSIVTADSFATAVLILYLAYILRIYVQKVQINYRQYLILGLIASMLALSKIVMIIFVPLVLLLVFRQKVKIDDKHRTTYYVYIWLMLIMIAATLVTLGWSLLSGNLKSGSTLPVGVNPTTQIHNVIFHPTEFIFALWNTNFYTWSDGVIRSTIGTFGWSDTPMALIFMVLGYLSLFVVMIGNRGEDYGVAKKLTHKLPIFFLFLLGVAYFIGVSLALFVYYTPVNFNIIVGLQGRYFLPLFILPIVIFLNKDAFIVNKKFYLLMVKVLPLFLLSISLLYVFIRYYQNTLI